MTDLERKECIEALKLVMDILHSIPNKQYVCTTIQLLYEYSNVSRNTADMLQQLINEQLVKDGVYYSTVGIYVLDYMHLKQQEFDFTVPLQIEVRVEWVRLMIKCLENHWEMNNLIETAFEHKVYVDR